MSGTLTPYATNVRWGPQEKTRIVIDGPGFGPPASRWGPGCAPEHGMRHVLRATWSIPSGGSAHLAQCAGSVAASVRRSLPTLGGSAGIRLPAVAESTFIAGDRTPGVSSVPSRHRAPFHRRSQTPIGPPAGDRVDAACSQDAARSRPRPGRIEILLSELPGTMPRRRRHVLQNPGTAPAGMRHPQRPDRCPRHIPYVQTGDRHIRSCPGRGPPHPIRPGRGPPHPLVPRRTPPPSHHADNCTSPHPDPTPATFLTPRQTPPHCPRQTVACHTPHY